MEEFVSVEEEALLLAAIDWSSRDDDVTGELLPDALGLVLMVLVEHSDLFAP